ncbi:MAG: LacI family DNA-binding transcriptional regulator [Roseburia sp.]
MVTIKDIARESGYSVSTVSRVLNERRDVSPDAKKKIEEIVAKYNFVPNNNAKHLKQTATKTIGVLIKGTSNMLFANILEEIQQIIEKTSYTLMVSYLDEDANEVEQALVISREKKPRGLLFLGGNPDYFKDGFQEVEIPCVLVTNRADALHFPNLSSVATDDIAAAKCAVDTLIDAGHRRIGVIGGDIARSHTSKQRYLGCQKSFEEHQIPFDATKDYSKARFSFDSAYRATERLLKSAPDISAIFAMSDVMAIGAIRALIDMNYKVPQDISVIGFDGTVLAEYYHPKLTTIKQQYQTLATRSIELLFGQLEFKRDAIHEVVPFELVSGESIRKL